MGSSISRITTRIFAQTMTNASKLEYINLNVIYSTKHIYYKLGETSREDTRNTSIISNTIRTIPNIHNTSWTHTMNMNKWARSWITANNFMYTNKLTLNMRETSIGEKHRMYYKLYK
jgi:hypothetical protein